jgi:hypothetical protein
LVSYLDVVYAQTALLANQRVLTQISGQRMVAMAEKALADPSPKVRASAARALGPMGAESVNLHGWIMPTRSIVGISHPQDG